MYILGISAYYHDSAAVLLKDGIIVSAIEEERFSRIKHDNNFPYQAIEHCLNANKIAMDDIDAIAYYEKPLLKFERILETFIQTYPFALKPFLKGIPEWLDYKIKIEYTIRKRLEFKGTIYFIPHHLSHAAACYFSSPYKQSAILTIDGVGEYQTTGLWTGEKNSIKPLKKIDFPNSIGLLYSTFTAFLGFKVNEDEYKLMGLAAYGKPAYAHKIKKIIDVKKDGSFMLDMQYFSFREEFHMWDTKFESLFGKPRKPVDPIHKRHADLAASIQAVTETIYFQMINHLYRLTQSDNLCIGGGVALNALANGKLYTETGFKNFFVFGAAGDSGAAMGAALYVHGSILAKKRMPVKNLCLGSSYTNKEIEKTLIKHNISFKKYTGSEIIRKASQLLHKGKIIGWFQGKCEFGPRALGSRSILSRAYPRNMKSKVNIIKKREQFRPFAGSILQNHIHRYLNVSERNLWSPFMTFCFPVQKNRRKKIVAIVHTDGTCRIQTVNKDNGLYYKLINQYYTLSGIPIILNTSFNLKGEPIVERPEQAVADFLKTKMDCLIIGNFLVTKN